MCFFLLLFLLFLKYKIFSLVWTTFIKILEKVCIVLLTVIALMFREMTLNGIFSIFPLAQNIKLMVYLKACHWISKRMFYRTDEISISGNIYRICLPHFMWWPKTKRYKNWMIYNFSYFECAINFSDVRWTISRKTKTSLFNVTFLHKFL